MDNLFKLSSDYIDYTFGYQEPMRFYKGVTEVSFDLSEFQNNTNPIVKLDIDFNDGSEVISKFYNFEYPYKIVDLIKKTYYPNKDHHTFILSPTFLLKFLNGKEFVYQCPIKITKNSFFTEFSNINVTGAQFIDNEENSLFVTLDTGIGDILNIKIK
jgi:hypothetical protein